MVRPARSRRKARLGQDPSLSPPDRSLYPRAASAEEGHGEFDPGAKDQTSAMGRRGPRTAGEPGEPRLHRRRCAGRDPSRPRRRYRVRRAGRELPRRAGGAAGGPGSSPFCHYPPRIRCHLRRLRLRPALAQAGRRLRDPRARRDQRFHWHSHRAPGLGAARALHRPGSVGSARPRVLSGDRLSPHAGADDQGGVRAPHAARGCGGGGGSLRHRCGRQARTGRCGAARGCDRRRDRRGAGA